MFYLLLSSSLLKARHLSGATNIVPVWQPHRKSNISVTHTYTERIPVSSPISTYGRCNSVSSLEVCLRITFPTEPWMVRVETRTQRCFHSALTSLISASNSSLPWQRGIHLLEALQNSIRTQMWRDKTHRQFSVISKFFFWIGDNFLLILVKRWHRKHCTTIRIHSSTGCQIGSF